jgi:peptide/nickel transport system substrate-binding protein
MTSSGVSGRQVGTAPVTRRQFMRQLAGVALVSSFSAGLLSSAMAVPVFAQDTATAPSDTQVVIAQISDPSTTDPHNHNTALVNSTPVFSVYDGLTRYDANDQVGPWLATSWQLVDDTTWEFKIRTGVTFHNGEPFDAGTAKDNIDRMINPDNKLLAATVFGVIDHATAVDPQTLHVITKQPDSLLPKRFSAWGSPMMSLKYLQSVGLEKMIAQPMGTGMYKFVDWVRDSHITLERNENWWGPKPAYQRVIIRSIPTVSSMLDGLLNGEVDYITDLSTDQVPVVNGGGKARATHTVQDEFMILMCNVLNNGGAITNQGVRQALSLSIDRESLATNVDGGYARPSYQFLAPTDALYDPNPTPILQDLDAAKALLAQSGYNNEEVVLNLTEGSYPNDRALMEAVAAMGQQAGLNMRVRLLEPSVSADEGYNKTFQGVMLTTPSDQYFDPDGGLYRLLQPGSLMSTWGNQDGIALMAKARTLLKPEDRWPLYQQAMQMMRTDLPWIPFLENERVEGVSNRLDWKPRKQDQLYVEDMKPAAS